MRALADKERQLGDDHSTTLMMAHSLADLCRIQRKLDEAEGSLRAPVGDEAKLGPHHPSTPDTHEVLLAL